MKITRLYTGQDGETHFEDLDVPLFESGPIGELSEPIDVRNMHLRETRGDYHYTWHNAPCRQYVIMLEGQVEIEIGDGSRRIFSAGDILLAEDTTGRGHVSRAVDGKPRRSIFITLAEKCL